MLKAPFRPKVAGRIAFWFSPIAGAIVSVISLRRTGHPLKARRVFLWTLGASMVLAAVLLVVTDGMGRIIGLATEFGFYALLPQLQDREFDEWQAANPGLEPASGWGAIGWGFAGLALFLLIFILLAIVMPTRWMPS